MISSQLFVQILDMRGQKREFSRLHMCDSRNVEIFKAENTKSLLKFKFILYFCIFQGTNNKVKEDYLLYV